MVRTYDRKRSVSESESDGESVSAVKTRTINVPEINKITRKTIANNGKEV